MTERPRERRSARRRRRVDGHSIVRCAVDRVRPVSVFYRGAVQFDEHVSLFVHDWGGYALHTPEMRPGRHRGAHATRDVF